MEIKLNKCYCGGEYADDVVSFNRHHRTLQPSNFLEWCSPDFDPKKFSFRSRVIDKLKESLKK